MTVSHTVNENWNMF